MFLKVDGGACEIVSGRTSRNEPIPVQFIINGLSDEGTWNKEVIKMMRMKTNTTTCVVLQRKAFSSSFHVELPTPYNVGTYILHLGFRPLCLYVIRRAC